ncbi:MAG: SDR family oxidoreductase [Proteobacteria bacterium]|nr:SDR family oxidoreductase [Pseudomonadota bacterium]MCZ6894620.1 SDR family oxidoreductase [Gammaproteobacteria bacterium]
MDPLILITGASRGIGAATARLAAARGYAVGVNFVRDEAAARGICDQIEMADGRALLLPGDVSNEEHVLRMFDQLDAFDANLTALVNNAGVVGRIGPFSGYDSERLKRTFDINIYGAFLCARETVKRLSTASGGTGGAIVNVSSAAARIGSPNEFVDYAASKAAIDAMTLGLAKEYGAQGIRVNSVRPGIVDTDIHASAGAPDRVEKFSSMVPMKRAGSPEEVARVILWLLSDEASYTTGAFVDISGGR